MMELAASARRPSRLVVSSLLLAAVISIPLALRERATADFLRVLAGAQGSPEATRAVETTASWYDTVFWFDLGLAAGLGLVAIAVIRRASSSWYAAAALVAGFAGGSGTWALLGNQPEIRGALPVGVLAFALTAAAGIAVVGAIRGWAATAPPGPRSPLNPPVPPSHQAG
jgi:hypothetical protein